MKCAFHLDRDAVSICNHCGRSVCGDCQALFNYENYCKECAAGKTGEPKKMEHSPSLAATLSFIVPGLGQIYNGQHGKGILIFLTSWLLVPWIIGIFDARKVAVKIKEGTLAAQVKPGCVIGFIIGVFAAYFLTMLLLVAAVIIPSFMQARKASIEQREAGALEELKLFAAALEVYAQEHDGAYPTDKETAVSYLPQQHRSAVTEGYVITQNLSAKGYQLVAKPQRCGATGKKLFIINTGGALTIYDCKDDK